MECKKASSLTDDFVYGLLEPADAEELALHIRSCEACAKSVEETRSRKKLLSGWEVKAPSGAADRLLARVRSERPGVQGAYGRLLVRVTAAAAVILAAVVLPRIFLAHGPMVLGYEPKTTSVEGIFRDSLHQDFSVPQGCTENACLIVRLRSVDGKSLVEAAIRLNEGGKGLVLTGASASEEVYLLTRERGLKEGDNSLAIDNLGSSPLEFEVTLVTGETQ